MRGADIVEESLEVALAARGLKAQAYAAAGGGD